MVCAVNKIDSNITGLAIAEEECLKQLPGVGGADAEWHEQEPNSYGDFGGNQTSVARAPINASRQKKKGTPTDLDVTANFNQDFTRSQMNSLLQGFFFADTRVRAESANAGGVPIAALTVSITAGGQVSIDAAEFEALNPAPMPGEWFYLAGPGATTKGFCRVDSIAGGKIIIGDTSMSLQPGAADVVGAGAVYVGNTLRNEQDPALIKRRSYTLERSLGQDATGTQYQYVSGAVSNQLTVNIPQTEKVNCDLSYIACDETFHTGAQGAKIGSRVASLGEDAINTSSDIKRIKLAVVDPLDSNPTATFGFVTQASFKINNNASPNKAIGTLGAFDVSVGDFEAGGDITAYFSTVAGVQAVRSNADFNFSVIGGAKNTKAGFVFDVPLCTLAGAKVTVTKDQAITIPVTPSGAQNKYGYTASYTYFPHLPDEVFA